MKSKFIILSVGFTGIIYVLFFEFAHFWSKHPLFLDINNLVKNVIVTLFAGIIFMLAVKTEEKGLRNSTFILLLIILFYTAVYIKRLL